MIQQSYICVYVQQNSKQNLREICTPMFAVLFTTTKRQKQPKYPLKNDKDGKYNVMCFFTTIKNMRSEQCTERNESLTIKRKSHLYQELLFHLLQSCGARGHKPCWLSELSVLGTCPWCENLQSWGTFRCGSKHFAPQGEAGSWGFPPSCMVLC